MGPRGCTETWRHNYRSAPRNMSEARKHSVDIPLPAYDRLNDVFRRISPRYYQRTVLVQDTTACFKIIAHRQDRVILKQTSFI